MEELQVQSAHVVQPPIELINEVIRMKLAGGEASESSCGPFSSHYRLDRGHDFFLLPIVAFRDLLAAKCQEATGSPVYAAPVTHANPIFRPTLVASVKHGHTGLANFQARVAFDIDSCAKKKGGVEFPTAEQLWELCCAFMQAHCSFSEEGIEMTKERCLVFMGSFDDTHKRVSAHVYFCDLAWSNDSKNQLTKTDPLKKEFDTALSRFGVEWDAQVSTQGLKYPFMDKWDPKALVYRNKSQLLKFTNGFDDRPLTWRELFHAADPLCCLTDTAFNRFATLQRIDRPTKRPADNNSGIPATRHLSAVANGTLSVRERIVKVVPQWADCTMNRKRQPGTTFDIWVPQSTYCPLKKDPSANSPAFEHSSRGKAYAVVDAIGSITVKCHICNGASLHIHKAEAETKGVDEVLTYFNSRYARYQDRILMYPLKLDDPLHLYTYRQFRDAEAPYGTVKVNGRNMTLAQFWSEHPMARTYTHIECDPTETCPETTYNTYKGFDARVMALAEEFSSLSDEELMAKRKNVEKLLRVNMCDDDVETYKYVCDWIALMVQRPEYKWGTALVLTGPPGCGKGVCVSELLTMIGPAHSQKCESRDLVDAFNSMTSESILIFGDEAVSEKAKSAQNALKLLITEHIMVVRQKYQNNRNARCFQKLILASNDPDPVFMQNGERRFVPIGCDYRIFGQYTPEHQNLCADAAAEIESLQAPAALYVLCKRRDLSTFEPRKFPVSSARFKMHYESFTNYERFVYRFIRDEQLIWNFEAPFNDKGEPTPLRKKTELIIKDNKGCRKVEEIGRDIFNEARKGDQYPKELMQQAYCHMYAHSRDVSGLWKYLYSLFPNKDSAWGVKRVGTNKLGVFTIPTKRALQVAFMKATGEHDERIWGAWAQME